MLACLVALGIGACSDDGRVIGERAASGGTSGQAGSGASGQSGSDGASPTGGSSGDASGGTASNAGTANGGTENAGTAGDATGGDAGAGAGGAGGSSTGGAGGTAGDAGRGGAAGGAGSGGAGAGGGNGGMSGSSGMNCVDRNCSASEACVAHRTIGGAQIRADDAGACPSGAHLEGNICFADFAYQCVAQPRCAAGEVNCTCGTCPQGSPSCRAPYAADWLDPSAKLVCELLAP